jgi:hypothetical protein
MPVLKYCVEANGKVYCWNQTRQMFTEAVLVDKPDTNVPDEIKEMIMRKWLLERGRFDYDG